MDVFWGIMSEFCMLPLSVLLNLKVPGNVKKFPPPGEISQKPGEISQKPGEISQKPGEISHTKIAPL